MSKLQRLFNKTVKLTSKQKMAISLPPRFKKDRMTKKKDNQDTDAVEEKINTGQDSNVEEGKADNSTEDSKSEEKAPTLQEKFDELNDKYLRLYSDFDNYRKRTMKEKVELISNAGAGIVKDLLPILDDFERAIKSNETVTDEVALKEGFSLISTKINSILTAKGLKKMEAKELPFDSELHEAITNIPAPTEDLKGKVVDVVEQGYYLNDKVIRYAKVVVGQ